MIVKNAKLNEEILLPIVVKFILINSIILIKIEGREKMLEKDFKNIIFDIKNQINNTQIEIFQNANKSLLKLYYNIGKIIEENSSWGNKFIDELAIELKISFPNIKGFSVRNLKNMKKYYVECQKSQIAGGRSCCRTGTDDH